MVRFVTEVPRGVMALTKETVVDQITVQENGVVLYRLATRILEDGTVISKTYARGSACPGDDVSGLPDRVAAICEAAWTPDVIFAYHETMQMRG